VRLGFHGLGNRQNPRLGGSIYRVFGPRRSAQEVKAVSISNRGLNPLLVMFQRNFVKNTVGEISFGGEDSQPETITAWAGVGHFITRWDEGLALDCDDGPRRS
jgi:hypothetical protein